MPVPDYQQFFLPILRFAGDGQEHSPSQAVEAVVKHFNLTEDDRNERLPSGAQSKVNNRASWSRFHLVKAGLLEAIGRGRFKITGRGAELLKTTPAEINLKLLNQYPEFAEFRMANRQTKPTVEEVSDATGDIPRQTPQELLEISYQALHRQLAQELLDRIAQSSPRFFEKLVVDLLVSMGYGGSRKDAGKAIGKSGDEGIDGIIKEDRLGLDAVYLQAKRWKGTVGRPEIQAFAGSLEGHRARKGVFITTSQFSPDAMEYVNRIEKKIILIDGQQLASLSIEYKVGVMDVINYSVRKLDLDYFEEE
ncbi:MAG TPA: restriction endonuclease [Edaphobacter sp.]|nr:restriction endonuclease [Edaphobacter sp.]